jgi:predicted phage terminase large subunit-like protein
MSQPQLLTAHSLKGLSEGFLKKSFDEPTKTPDCHLEWWELCSSPHPQVALAAPRNHAKSTSITHVYTIGTACFRIHQYIIIVSDTESQAVEFLGDIKTEFRDNEDLKKLFGISKIVKDSETDIIVRMSDGYEFRILAKGAEQKLRGRKWRNKRPSLIICDDLENEELTSNPDRREKFRRWFFAACKQSLRHGGQIRVVGTILHEDSLLNRLMRNKTWKTKLYKAHESFDDFSNILWPERFSEEDLRLKRQEFIEEGTPEDYSQEYLNDPFDNASTFFRRSDFQPIQNKDEYVRYYAGGDFAISKSERADFTSFKVVGVTSKGKFRVVHSVKGRWDSLEIMEEMFNIERRYHPDIFFVESDKIEKAIGPVLNRDMGRDRIDPDTGESTGEKNPYINLEKITPSKDKQTRARPLQKMMRSGDVEWDTEADWYEGVKQELIRFPKGTHDDDVDSTGIIFLGLQMIGDTETEEDLYEEEYEQEFGFNFTGQSEICGY